MLFSNSALHPSSAPVSSIYIRVKTKLSTGIGGQAQDYNIVNTIDAVLETKN